MAFKEGGEPIVLLGSFRYELGGSEYLSVCHGLETGAVPQVDLEEEKALLELLQLLNRESLLSSCHDISDGGLAVTLAESCIKGKIGCTVELETSDERCDRVLFSEAPSRAVISFTAQNMERVMRLASQYKIKMNVLGITGGDKIVIKLMARKS
jgi:phosphoribosylformylglycinamidine synthase